MASCESDIARLDPAVAAATRRRRVRQRQPRERRGFVTSAEHTPQAFGGVLLASPVIIVLLLPLSAPLVMTGDMMRWPWALGQLFGRFDYGFWLANTILLAGAAAFMTVVVAIPAGHKLGQWQSAWSPRLASALGMLGMTALPVAFVPLAWLQGQWPVADGRWLLVMIYGASAICIGTWLAALVSRGDKPIDAALSGGRSSSDDIQDPVLFTERRDGDGDVGNVRHVEMSDGRRVRVHLDESLGGAGVDGVDEPFPGDVDHPLGEGPSADQGRVAGRRGPRKLRPQALLRVNITSPGRWRPVAVPVEPTLIVGVPRIVCTRGDHS